MNTIPRLLQVMHQGSSRAKSRIRRETFKVTAAGSRLTLDDRGMATLTLRNLVWQLVDRIAGAGKMRCQ